MAPLFYWLDIYNCLKGAIVVILDYLNWSHVSLIPWILNYWPCWHHKDWFYINTGGVGEGRGGVWVGRSRSWGGMVGFDGNMVNCYLVGWKLFCCHFVTDRQTDTPEKGRRGRIVCTAYHRMMIWDIGCLAALLDLANFELELKQKGEGDFF